MCNFYAVSKRIVCPTVPGVDPRSVQKHVSLATSFGAKNQIFPIIFNRMPFWPAYR